MYAMRIQPFLSRFILSILVLMLGIASLLAQQPIEGDGYYYDKYHVQMVVHPDNTYSVLEQMDIVFTRPMHGIYRSLVTDTWINRDVTEAQDGSVTELRHYQPKFTDIDCSAPFRSFDENGILDIRIGSADSFYEGPTHIDLYYKMHVPSDRVLQADLFFYSLLGTGESCSTSQFTFSIGFDKALPEASLAGLKLYTGELGDNIDHSGSVITTRTSTMIEGELAYISPYQAVSIYIPLPEGYFPVETPWEGYVAWVFILLALIVLAYVIYKEIHNDSHVTPVVSFNPPNGMCSAEVGTLIDCSVDDCDLVSLIPWLANEGYLSIKKENGNLVLYMSKSEDPSGLPDYVYAFYKALFASGPRLDTGKPTSRAFGSGWLSAQSKAEKHFNDNLNESNTHIFKWLLLGILLTAMGVAWGTAAAHAWYFGVLVLLTFSIVALCLWVGYTNVTRYTSLCFVLPLVLLPVAYISGYAPETLVGIIRSILAETIGIETFGPHYLEASYDLYVPRLVFNGVLLIALLASCLSLRLYTITPYRRKYLGELLGLREFILTAEKSRLEMLLEKDEQYFYRILPFAVVFGLAKEWVNRFDGLDRGTNPNYIDTSASDLARLNRTFTSDTFRNGIMAEEKARAEAAAKARARASSGSSSSSARSYGGGGGGYSGGGFGGGGSRGW